MSFPTPTLLFLAAPIAAVTLIASFSPSGSTSRIVSPERSPYPPAHIDIKPGSCPNPVNVNHPQALEEFNGVMVDVLPVSIIGNKFDVEQINLGTVALTRSGFGLELPVYPIQMNFADTGTPFKGGACECHDLTGDGEMDLDLKFDKSEVIEAFGLQFEEDGAFIELEIRGIVKGEYHFSASDCIRIINH